MDTLIPARKRAASVALLFCGRDGKTDLSGVGNVGGAGVGNRELGLDKIGGVDRRSCDLKDTKPAAKIKSTASALREVFTKPEWILGIGACKTHISPNLGERRCRFNAAHSSTTALAQAGTAAVVYHPAVPAKEHDGQSGQLRPVTMGVAGSLPQKIRN